MEILYYFEEKSTPMYQWQEVQIFDELARHNCYIHVFNPDEYASIDEANEKLLQCLKKESYDLFLTPHNEHLLYVNTLKKVKKIGIPMVLICFDSLMTPLAHKNVVNYFDVVMISQKDKNNVFKKYGCNFVYSPYAANPWLNGKVSTKNEISNVCFIGTPYGSRINQINTLIDNNIKLDLYANFKTDNAESKSSIQGKVSLITALKLAQYPIGRKVILGAIKQKYISKTYLHEESGYVQIFPAVDSVKMCELFSRYALSLSVSDARNTGVLKDPVSILHLRNFEIPMCGGLQICKYFDDLAECFEEDKEVIFYRSQEEFIEKTRFYLDDNQYSTREKIKQTARHRAEQEHTWFCRFKKVFDYLGLHY